MYLHRSPPGSRRAKHPPSRNPRHRLRRDLLALRLLIQNRLPGLRHRSRLQYRSQRYPVAGPPRCKGNGPDQRYEAQGAALCRRYNVSGDGDSEDSVAEESYAARGVFGVQIL